MRRQKSNKDKELTSAMWTTIQIKQIKVKVKVNGNIQHAMHQTVSIHVLNIIKIIIILTNIPYTREYM